MTHESTFYVRTFHCDSFGHVNNARHLEFLEESRWRFGEAIGLTPLLEQAGFGFIVFDLQMRFRKPVEEGALLRIETQLIELGTTTGELEQTAFANDSQRPSLAAKFRFLLIDRANANKSVDITGAIRDCLEGVLLK